MSFEAEALKRFSLLTEFSEEDREQLLEVLDERTLRAGRTLFREGSESDGMLLIVSGTVKLEASRLREPQILSAGSALGAVSLLAVGPREATATSTEACELWFLPRTSFRRLVDDAPRTAFRLLEAVSRELAAAIRPALDRVAGIAPR